MSSILNKIEATIEQIKTQIEIIEKADIASVYRQIMLNSDDPAGPKLYDEEKESNIADIIKDAYNKTYNHLNDINTFWESNSQNHTIQMERFLEEFLNEIPYLIDTEDYRDMLQWADYETIDLIEARFKSIFLLIQFADTKDNIVLIGGNGCGKSTLAQCLKGDDSSNMTVVPAQKFLFFIGESNNLSIRKDDVQSEMLRNSIEMSKADADYGFSDYQKYQFTKLIIAMRDDFHRYLRFCHEENVKSEKGVSAYDKVRSIINDVFPGTDLKFGDYSGDIIYCTRNGEKYSVNGMSEGEKAGLYYAMSVMMAPENSFVVVDEPETFLNPSLANTIWDRLIYERSDCKFIFITHSVNFTLARNGSQIVWIKAFDYPDTFQFEIINDNFTLPKQLLTEVLGSKKPILFCEGEDKTSLDYRIYSALFQEKYTVIPVGGHVNVKHYCKVLNGADWIGLECKGIIDGDLRDENLSKRMINSIVVLPFNEIEMLLLSDPVMTATVQGSYPEDYEFRINQFKQEFWEKVSEEKEHIAIDKTITIINDKLETEKLSKAKNVEDIKKNLRTITDYDVDAMNILHLNEVERTIKEKDFNNLLKICNLKTEISRGLANKYLDTEYEKKSVEHVVTDETLKEILRKKYFSPLLS